MTRIIVDTHLHIYPWYDTGKVFACLLRNLAAHGGGAVKAAILTERADCSLFEDLREGRKLPPESWTLSPTGENVSLAVDSSDGDRIYLCAGRQIVTAERLEVLSLLADPRGLDGSPAEKAIAAVTAAGGVAVLPWAPGKWFFRRGRIVRDLVERCRGAGLLLGDTTLRPLAWGEPRLMAAARRKSIAIVAGSDPLPVNGEEQYAGSYASILEGLFDVGRPAGSLQKLFRTPEAVRERVGRRCGTVAAFGRLYRNSRA